MAMVLRTQKAEVEKDPQDPQEDTEDAEEQVVEAWLQETGLLSAQGSPLLVLLQPGARYSLKVWSSERFAQLADRLAEAFAEVMKSIKRVGGNVERGNKTERKFRTREIVINRLGYTDDGHTTIVKLHRDSQRAFAAEYYEAFDS